MFWTALESGMLGATSTTAAMCALLPFGTSHSLLLAIMHNCYSLTSQASLVWLCRLC